MHRKKILFGLLFLALCFTVYGFVNQNITVKDEPTEIGAEAKFFVLARNGKSVSPSTLKNATSIADLIEHYPSSWITNYDSVVVHTTSNGRQYNATGKDANLTARQMQLLSTADMFTDVVVSVRHKTTNSITKELEDGNMSLKIYVRPEVEAVYPGGIMGLQDFLRENSKDEIAKLEAKTGFLAIVYFTINEKGRPEAIEVSEVEEYKGVERVIRQVIQEMPQWAPAKDENGNAVKQKFEFVFGFGNEGGC